MLEIPTSSPRSLTVLGWGYADCRSLRMVVVSLAARRSTSTRCRGAACAMAWVAQLAGSPAAHQPWRIHLGQLACLQLTTRQARRHANRQPKAALLYVRSCPLWTAHLQA